jgi:hypothetical protein
MFFKQGSAQIWLGEIEGGQDNRTVSEISVE